METDSKKTLILGASTNPDRYAYRAAAMLTDYGHPIVLVGNKKGEVFGTQIQKDFPTTRRYQYSHAISIRTQSGGLL
jgi:predicted CoA-binding protein